jgi:hypothetical protein
MMGFLLEEKSAEEGTFRSVAHAGRDYAFRAVVSSLYRLAMSVPPPRFHTVKYADVFGRVLSLHSIVIGHAYEVETVRVWNESADNTFR